MPRWHQLPATTRPTSPISQVSKYVLRVLCVQNKWERIDKRGLEELMQRQRIELEALKNESRVIKAERASMQEHLQTLNLQLTRGK